MTRPEYIGYFDACGGENLDVSQRVVRCGDCAKAGYCKFTRGEPSGFCAWGVPKDDDTAWLTCKCGHEMETEGMCPFCGRMVRDDG